MTSRIRGTQEAPAVLPATLRQALGGGLTERAVDAVEHRDGCATAYLQVGDLEELDGAMWLVAGIFEPAHPRGRWTVAHARRTRHGTELRSPVLTLAQEDVLRVHDAMP